MNSLVAFDFDGTLADSIEVGLEIWNKPASEFGFHSLSPGDAHLVRVMNKRELIRSLNIPLYRLPLVLARATQAFRERMHHVRPFPGIPEVVRTLHDRGDVLGVITSNSVENVRTFLRVNEMDVFRFVCQSPRFSGKGKELRVAVRNSGLPATRAAYVGDESRDVEAARAARIRSIAVSWGYDARRILESQRPDAVVDDPAHLLRVLTNAQDKQSSICSPFTH